MDSRKPLTAGEVEELKEEIRTMPHKEFFGEKLQPLVDDHSRLSALLTPPPDAAVREAVERLENDLACIDGGLNEFIMTPNVCADLRTLIRAVQAPRLTGEQVEAVKEAHARLMAYACPADEDAGEGLEAAFPEALAGEVGRGE